VSTRVAVDASVQSVRTESEQGGESLKAPLTESVLFRSRDAQETIPTNIQGRNNPPMQGEQSHVGSLHSTGTDGRDVRASIFAGPDQAEDFASHEKKEGFAERTLTTTTNSGLLKDGGHAGHKDGGPLPDGGREASPQAGERATPSDGMFSRSLFDVETAPRETTSARSELGRNVLDQVQQGAFRNLGQGRKQLSLQLNPGNLGTVQVILQVKGKEVNAVLRTSKEETSKILGDQISQLKDQLEKQGLRVTKLEVQNQMASNDRPEQWNGGSEHNQSRERFEEGMRELRWRSMQRGGEFLARDMQNTDHTVNVSPRGVDFFA